MHRAGAWKSEHRTNGCAPHVRACCGRLSGNASGSVGNGLRAVPFASLCSHELTYSSTSLRSGGLKTGAPNRRFVGLVAVAFCLSVACARDQAVCWRSAAGRLVSADELVDSSRRGATCHTEMHPRRVHCLPLAQPWHRPQGRPFQPKAGCWWQCFLAKDLAEEGGAVQGRLPADGCAARRARWAMASIRAVKINRWNG